MKLATPPIEKTEPGVVVPMPTLPSWSTMNAVEVAKAAVEVDMEKSGAVPPEAPATESRAYGVEVPIPKLPFVARKTEEVAASVSVPLK